MTTEAAAPATTQTAPAAAAATPAAAPQQMSLLADAAASAAKPAVATPAAATGPAPVAEPNKNAAASTEQPKQPNAKESASDAAKDGKAKATESVPAEVEIKLPDGVKADALFDGFKALAKAEGLKSEQAQKVVDLFHTSQKAAVEAAAKARDEQVASMRKAIETDKELGGDHLAETRAVVSRVLNDPRTPAEFNELIKDPILGNHPALVRFLANWGKAIGEDSVEGTVAGDKSPSNMAPKEFRDRVFYNHPKRK